MTESVKLSYLITTFNKLAYLSVTLPLLIASKKEDEEIIVVDGASADGSVEYLNQLYEQGKIQQFISEKDYGEANGYNKAMLMAKAPLLKIITDDDAFDYNQIAYCRQYMETYPEADILVTDGAGWLNPDGSIKVYSSTDDFRIWLDTKRPFTFTCLGVMIRRSSLPLLGLLNTSFIRVDAEYGFRVTATKCNMVWYTGICWFHLGNNDSNSYKFMERMGTEMVRLTNFYLPLETTSIKKILSKAYAKLREIITPKKKQNGHQPVSVSFQQAVILLSTANNEFTPEFISKNIN